IYERVFATKPHLIFQLLPVWPDGRIFDKTWRDRNSFRGKGMVQSRQNDLKEGALMPDLKRVAADVDGTFVRSDYTYDKPRFARLLARMARAGCRFVVASGNQYY